MASNSPALQPALTFTGDSPSSSLNAAQQALNSTVNTTQLDNTAPVELYSGDSSIMANAWQLPANAGALRLNSGQLTGKPANPKDRAYISQSVQMLDLYGKFESGQPLTHAEMTAASELGGDIARAAQMAERAKTIPAKPAVAGKPGKPGLVPSLDVVPSPGQKATKAKTVPAKGAQRAFVAANKEIATRLEKTAGIDPGDLSKQGLNAKVPKSFAAIMQNAGYGITQNMSLSQALDAASGKGPQATPSAFSSAGMTVSQYIQSLQHMSKAQLYGLQKQLFNGGFFDPSYSDGSKEYTQGVLDIGTIEAMRTAILQTLQQNASGQNVSLEQVISQGEGSSTLGGQGSLTGSKTASIPMATQTQTQQPMIDAFVKQLGRNPSQSELAAFTAQYNQELTNSSKTATEAGLNAQGIVDYQTGIPFVQGTPTVSAAATQYAENQDPTEYQAHNVADAFGMLMNLVDRQGTSALDTPGTRPTGTT